MTDVVVVIGSGSIGQAIARRVSAGKYLLLADLREENAAPPRSTGDGPLHRHPPSAVRHRLY
jgi:NAD(P)-dependent dehydrogenase (short-subunit alcohol dehydrogenase family)